MAKILVVDDDALTLKLLKHILERAGHEVRTVSRPRDAVETAVSWEPGVVTIDLMMPEVEGTRVIEQLRSTPSLKALKIVIVSSQENPALIRPLLSQSVEGFCAKNVAGEKLTSVIRAVLSGKKDAAFSEPDDLAPATTAARPQPRFTQLGAHGVIEFAGSLDERTEEDLAATNNLGQALAKDVVMDVTKVQNFSKKGVQSLSKLLQAWRSRRRHAVIVASGTQENELRELGLDIGADIFYNVEDAVRFLK